MSVLQSIVGQYGGLTGAAKQGQKQMSILEMLGLGGGAGYTAPIGPMQDGSAMPAESVDPQQYAQQQSAGLGDLGSRLATWGAGVSKAAGPSRLPVDFGQALSGGQDAVKAQDQQELGNIKTAAEISALGQKGKPDFDATAQSALIKMKMGVPLTPEETASLQAWDTMNTAKTTTFGLPNGGYTSAPAARSILPPGFGGAQQMAPQGGGQQIDPRQRLQQLEEMRRKAGVQ